MHNSGDRSAGPSKRRRRAFVALLDESTLREVLAMGVRRAFDAGETLWLQGSQPEHVYVVEDGHVQVKRVFFDGTEFQIGVAGPGELLGELAAIDGSRRTTMGQAIEPSTVVRIPAERYVQFVRAHPKLLWITMRIAIQRQRQAEGLAVSSATASVSVRLARQVLVLARTAGNRHDGAMVVETGMSQQALGEAIGASRRAVAKVLAGWRDEGLVETQTRRVIVRDPDRLVEIARDDGG